MASVPRSHARLCAFSKRWARPPERHLPGSPLPWAPGLLDASGVHSPGTLSIDRTQPRGPEGTGDYTHRRGLSLDQRHLRKKFELYANFRPIKNLPGLDTRYPGVDLVIVRENTEGEYVGLEHEVVPGVVESLKIVTEKGSTRIAKFAFEYARKFHRRKIHAIHKANIMKMSDGLFLRCAREVAKGFPEITYGEHIIDNTCMQLVMNPYQYDMLLIENLYGDIVSDLCAAFVGGLGLVPGANLGNECAIFEAVHGSAPDIAGKDIANPTALLQSSILMLHHIGEDEAAARTSRVGKGVHREEGADPGRGRKSGTKAFTGGVLAAL